MGQVKLKRLANILVLTFALSLLLLIWNDRLCGRKISSKRLVKAGFATTKIFSNTSTDNTASTATNHDRTEGKVQSMVVSLDYWEQTGNAIKNLFDQQCWSKTVGITKVLEPFVKDRPSVLCFAPGEDRQKSMKFGDLFDLDQWNRRSLRHDYATLVSMDHFLKHASRDVIFVQIFDHCHELAAFKDSAWYKWLISRGFHVIKRACIGMDQVNTISDETFRERIFNGTERPVTVLFRSWRGMRRQSGPRVALSGPITRNCLRKMRSMEVRQFQPPPKITYTGSSPHIISSQEISSFVDRFLNEYLSGAGYVAVVLRTEKLDMKVLTSPLNQSACAREIITDWRRLTQASGSNRSLLFSDAGRFGSLTWNSSPAIRFTHYIEGAMNLGMNMSRMNSILTGMTGRYSAVQMAVIHQQLMACATCIVVVGGGVFQTQALNMYTHWHRGQECYAKRDKMCDSEYIEVVYGTT